jgi:uncharacterized membrane protein YedE/YeeE
LGFAIGGILVGFGTKLGNGCTSGHGVCGLPRFSIRSLVAVSCFLTSGLIIATLRGAFPFLEETQLIEFTESLNLRISALVVLIFSISAILVMILLDRDNIDKIMEIIISVLVGLIFGAGLAVSGMLRRSKIIGFLTLNRNWDPALMFVLAAAVCTNLLTF